MKKFFYIILVTMLMPLCRVNALKCYSELIDVKDTHSIMCIEVEGETLTFKDSTTAKDYNEFFTYSVDSENKNANVNISENISFDKVFPSGLIEVSDGVGNAIIRIKNKNYVEPTTTTTTTKDANIKTLKVTLDPNNGDEVVIKTCDINSVNTTCNVTLPNLDKDTFNGWGTAKTCKEGNSGTIKVEKNITYYACYKGNDITNSSTNNLYLKSIALVDRITNENIDFGTFSIKNNEYTFKVMNSVTDIDVNALSDEGININITGNENLIVGENKIVVELSDSNNNRSEYIFNVTRLNEGETINNIHYLKSLIIGGYNINFDKGKLVYNLTISNNIDKLEITAIQENEEDEVEVLNNNELKDGSQIKINVIGEDNNTTSYIINIAKEAGVNYLLLIGIGLILLLIIVLVVLIILKNKKKPKQNKKTQEQIEVLNI